MTVREMIEKLSDYNPDLEVGFVTGSLQYDCMFVHKRLYIKTSYVALSNSKLIHATTDSIDDTDYDEENKMVLIGSN